MDTPPPPQEKNSLCYHLASVNMNVKGRCLDPLSVTCSGMQTLIYGRIIFLLMSIIKSIILDEATDQQWRDLQRLGFNMSRLVRRLIAEEHQKKQSLL